MNTLTQALDNFRLFTKNDYPGRGLIVGLDESGRHAVQVSFITGRSQNSQNRIYRTEKGRVFTEPPDSAPVQNPELVLYNAMNEKDCRVFIVSNGRQTDEVLNSYNLADVVRILNNWSFEPDYPINTPRITGITLLDQSGSMYLILSSLKRLRPDNDACQRSLYTYPYFNVQGTGYCITTYAGNDNPLPIYRGAPLLLPLPKGIEEILDLYWNTLNPKVRVAVAVKFIQLATGISTTRIANRHTAS